jgi:trans-aconitate methyltransferase
MTDQTFNDVERGFDRVAAEYAHRIYGELDHKPLDRELLDRFAVQVQRIGSVCDLGCGPGHVTRYLHEQPPAQSLGHCRSGQRRSFLG